MIYLYKDKDLSVIPQFGATCWFNAILMVSLYSQYTRNVIIKASKKWNKKDSFLMVLKEILKNYKKKPEKVQTFFNKIKPEKILLKMLKKYNDYIFMYKMKLNFVKTNFDISFASYDFYYINLFLKYININALDILYYENKYLININKYMHKNNYTTYNGNEISKDTIKILKNVPEVLVITSFLQHNYLHKYLDYYNTKTNPFNSLLYDFEISDVYKLEDYITLNGYRYKLDSVIISSYNHINNMAHTIAGITCNNEKYVYNGFWINDDKKSFSLIKYDWNVNNDKDFCLNYITYNLNFNINKNDLCFNFSKKNSYRIFIFTKIDNNVSSHKSSSKNDLELSGVSDIVYNQYETIINKMSKEEILSHLKYLDIYFNNLKNYSKKDLQKVYIEYINNYLNIPKKTVIQKIKNFLLKLVK